MTLLCVNRYIDTHSISYTHTCTDANTHTVHTHTHTVVYHHGKTATGGHYTCDVHHPAAGGWVRADDSLVKLVPEEFVLKTGNQSKVAYILFYRRLDTIRT